MYQIRRHQEQGYSYTVLDLIGDIIMAPLVYPIQLLIDICSLTLIEGKESKPDSGDL